MNTITISNVTLTIDLLRERLQLNHPYTYKKLTQETGLPYLGSSTNSRNSQLKQLKRCMSFEKIKGKYIITEFYDEVMPEGIRSFYTSAINILLLSYLQDQEEWTVINTSSQWFALLGFVNGDYSAYYQSPKRLLEIMTTLPGIGDYKVKAFRSNYDIFRQRVSRYFRQTLIRSLDDLADKKILTYNPDCFMVYNGNTRNKAIPQQHNAILDIEKDALEHFKCSNYSMIKLRGIGTEKKYYDYCNAKFEKWYREQEGIDESGGYIGYTHEIEVNYSKTNISKQITEEQENMKRIALNIRAYDWSNSNARTVSNNPKNYRDKRMEHYSIPVQEELADKCILLK